jgi:RhtB (resistance to homoserine/threonine) family protein
MVNGFSAGIIMSEIFMNWLLLVTVFGVAVISPGPDFIMAVRNSVLHSRRAGIFTAIGFGVGVVVHVIYTIAGLAAVIAASTMLFNILKYAGAAYLIFIGLKALKSHGSTNEPDIGVSPQTGSLSDWQAFRSGVITNLFNPKATMFFLALFSQLIHPNYSIGVQALFGATCVVMVMAWFSVVATVLTAPAIKTRFMRAAGWINRICGVFFIMLGFRLALTKAPI